MNKIFIALGLTLATITGAFAQSSALDAYAPRAFDAAEVTAAASATTPDLVVYDRPGNDGSPTFSAPQGGIDYTATASIGSVSEDQIVYDRRFMDGSPSFE